MPVVLFDTLRLSRTLRDKGHFSAEQAETLAEALGEATHEDLATNSDLAALKAEIAGVRTGIAEDRSELTRWSVIKAAFSLISISRCDSMCHEARRTKARSPNVGNDPVHGGRARARRRGAIGGIASCGFSRTAIYKWRAAVSKPGAGVCALASRPAPGRPRSLTARPEQQVFRWINGKDPRQCGLDFGLWTRRVVADLIERKFGIRLGLIAVGELLAKLNVTPQKPLQRVSTRSGSDREMAARDIPGHRGFTAELFVQLLRKMIRHRSKPVHQVGDKLPAHTTKLVKRYLESTKGRLTLHFPPGYAPELNPDELVWSHVKRTGVARAPLRKGERLLGKIEAQLAGIKKAPGLVRSFFMALHGASWRQASPILPTVE